jgi:hypothetical protein
LGDSAQAKVNMRAIRSLGLSLLLCATAFCSPPECRFHFTVVRHDGIVFALGQMFEAQQKWWNQKGLKKYRSACVDATNPEYFMVCKQIDPKSGIRFVYPTKIGTVTTTGPGTTIDAIQTGRTVNRIHLYLFGYRNGKIEGPLWMNDRDGEDRDERAWNQKHPASQQLLDDALKYLSQKQ